MTPIKNLRLLLAWIALGVSPALFAQSGGLFLTGDLTLTRNNEIRLPVPGGVLDIPMVPDDEIRLTPPDMATLAPRGVIRVLTDTIPQNSGPARCVSHVLVDTLYLGDGLFLTQAEITVPFFADGTFTGTSSFGRGALAPIGTLTGPMELGDLKGYGYRFEEVNPANQTILGRRLSLESMGPQPGFAIQDGDLARIHMVQCSNRSELQIQMDALTMILMGDYPFCDQDTYDHNIPPANALARLSKPVTIRYFESAHAERAEAMADVVAYLFGIPRSEVMVEDMQPNYGANPPIEDYLEIWMK